MQVIIYIYFQNMRHLGTIKFERIEESKAKSFEIRMAARALILDNEGKAAVLSVSARNYHKLPGGGVEEGEDMETALRRECLEETGCNIEILEELGKVEELRLKWNQHQISHCYLARVSGEKGEPQFTDSEKKAGFELEWFDPEEIARIIASDIPEDYVGLFIQKRDKLIMDAALSALHYGSDKIKII